MSTKIGICALCKKQNVMLRDSHIIPKLAYTRIKSFKTSRFRNIYDIKSIYQDGEKKPLLCQECETFFSKFETAFSKKYLDKFLDKKSKRPKLYAGLDTYIISVAWRILYDDIYVYNSFNDEFSRHFFEDFERVMHQYLDNIRTGKHGNFPKRLKNYIFPIQTFKYPDEVIELMESTLFGYSFHSGDYSKYIVFTYYTGIIFATVYRPPKVIILNANFIDWLLDKFTSKVVKRLLNKEINYQLNKMIEHRPVNEMILNNGLGDKIKKRYENMNKIR